ncbi:MAG TPA: 3-oxoacyl-[acyl-carrier-protein] synthase III C-terminal domain-containing protein [Thermoanaerobaculia bacterium]|nr:3-oxoacyl-[acyl-carrier-protein] synthase III C-terminal domain-containing protein [Thermoanaerobaculia bacterium]
MSERRALFLGSGIAVGPVVIDNHRWARVMTTTDEWIQERSGIRERRFVHAGTGSSDLGIEAARRALEDAGIEAAQLDTIVCVTMTPDHYFPGSGTLIQHGLGIDPCPAYDLRQQCAGFAYGLQMVNALVRSGLARTVLLVGTDVHTSLMPFRPRTWEVLLAEDDRKLDDPEEIAFNDQYRHLLVLFGDAAGAFVFRAHETDDGRGLIGAELFGDGGNLDILHVPGLGSKRRPILDEEALRTGDWVPVMDGRAVFKLAVTRMPDATRLVLERYGLGIEDVSLLIMHQANLRICEAAQKQLGLSDDKVFNNIQRYGNTTSATLPLAFHEARAAGRAREGDLVAFTALGAGLHWGAALMRM